MLSPHSYVESTSPVKNEVTWEGSIYGVDSAIVLLLFYV